MYQDIPKEFYSFETKEPFTHCIECEKYLLDGADYMVEKAMKRYEGFTAVDTVFDYAICVECAMKMRDEFSKESMLKMEDYFKNHMPVPVYPVEEELDMKDCLGKCMVKKVDISETSEYQIFAYCRGNKLMKNIAPYMISSFAIDEMVELLSKPTTDFLNGFYNKHFSPDPSLMEPVPGGRIVLI